MNELFLRGFVKKSVKFRANHFLLFRQNYSKKINKRNDENKMIQFSPAYIKSGTYLKLLDDIEKDLFWMLENENNWNTLDVTYEPPRVERVWRQHGEYRVYLHRIHQADENKVLYHPHPWPSSMRILKGTYKMGIGHGSKSISPPIDATFLLGENSRYEMVNPKAWHYVCPISDVTYSLMITGRPWKGEEKKSSYNLKPLPIESKLEILDYFKKIYVKPEITQELIADTESNFKARL